MSDENYYIVESLTAWKHSCQYKILHENFLFHNCLSKQLDNLLQTNPIKLGSKELFILFLAKSSRYLISCRCYTDWYSSSIWPLNLWQPVWHQREGWSCGLSAAESCRDARNEAGDWIKWLCLLPTREILKIRCVTLLLVLSRLETQQFNVGLHESETYENYARQQI